MYCALGKNDQKIHVVPSQNLVIIRMGDAADSNNLVPVALDYQMWEFLNKVFCVTTALAENITVTIKVFPNPFTDELNVGLENTGIKQLVTVYDVYAKTIYRQTVTGLQTINTSAWPVGIYFVQQGNQKYKVVKR